MALLVESRASTRHAPVIAETYLEIMDWPGKRVTRARLVDVSTGGALVLTVCVVATSQKLRVRLEGARETEWIVAEAVHFGRPDGVGIRFSWPCPDFVLEATRRDRSRLVNLSDKQSRYVRQVKYFLKAPVHEVRGQHPPDE
jgi:hypothetical protein